MNRRILRNEVIMGRFAYMIMLLALLLPLSGCAGSKGSAVKFDYYTLEYEIPMPGDAAMTGPLPVVLRLERFTAAPGYTTDRMVYRDSSNKRSVYNYHKWRAMPADLVTYFLKRDLANSGQFAGVLPPESGAPNTHVLGGTVEEFLEWDGKESWEAVITVNIVLLDPVEADVSKRVLLQKRFTAREPSEARQPAYVAQAMSRAMARLSLEIGTELHTVLKKTL
jgi:ABC-type uncharacterized transport system auxiliary subunit